ncbi:predicted protein [Thalassiosira pseudonana CCMP1335]|uniref:tRNA(Phe) 7-[(3-amino-3-carboxypropyl)-4-demethylwyosine(37)-N(4)]-methyltransferase n=1 Tax=Thalassiosira pseudonana TaxID=35128 RepID=B8C6V7_THAPS|nr:predicted protein [Thalassiosira pseudonana CCMP1335]EED90870.1 predicted protein [Thalassiosira pseudonana CCMP1335]
MDKKRWSPILSCPSSSSSTAMTHPDNHTSSSQPLVSSTVNANSTTLPSFPSLRSRNLHTLYGTDHVTGEYSTEGNDKSPKGSVDEKARPLVDLINRHPEYVTLSSCSGRVALFDPSGGGGSEEEEEEASNGVEHDGLATRGDSLVDADDTPQRAKSTKISGKGRGKWIFVTHDILPDLGHQMIQSLRTVGEERRLREQHHKRQTSQHNNNPPITFKHEPPLLHIAASSLAAGKKLLHIVKSVCALRESGLVLTDQRVTVEVRTTGTLLCLPLMITFKDEPRQGFELQPNDMYLMSLADMANERMAQNEIVLQRIYAALEAELFQYCEESSDCLASTTDEPGKTLDNEKYSVTLQLLPSLNVWKSAAVSYPLPSKDGQTEFNNFYVLAFGGQGVGPTSKDLSNTKISSCRRWDTVFCLSQRNGVWSDHWSIVSMKSSSDATDIDTNAGSEDCGEVFGLLGTPSDVRGVLPEPRFGHSCNCLQSESCDKDEPLLVISGGTGISSTSDGTSITTTLSSVHILSRVLDDANGLSHFVWGRISDLPAPRSYHATAVAKSQHKDHLFVFGGVKESNDAFCSSDTSDDSVFVVELSGVRKPTTTKSYELVGHDIPSLIGASAATPKTGSEMPHIVLIGGVEEQTQHTPGSRHANRNAIKILQLESSSSGVVARRCGVSITATDVMDFGSCVHQSVIALPTEHISSSSIAVVGGGVPSFAFGQSYSRSFAVNIASNHSKKKRNQIAQPPTQNPDSVELKNIHEPQHAHVIYVANRHAKTARTFLEAKGIFDKRYKLIHVNIDGESRIALPLITPWAAGEDEIDSLVVGKGKEMMPFSSSSMSKIMQRR